MTRDIPFEEGARCDVCGRMGAFDFMGDYLCANHASGCGPFVGWHYLGEVDDSEAEIDNVRRRTDDSEYRRTVDDAESEEAHIDIRSTHTGPSHTFFFHAEVAREWGLRPSPVDDSEYRRPPQPPAPWYIRVRMIIRRILDGLR